MRIALAVLAGRLTRWLTRLRGGGSAFPGKVVRAIAPRFLARAVSRLPQGVVFVSGSNGKSTTTHMVVGMLRAHGLKVFSNPAGGNLPQGIASAVLADVPLDGVLRHDIAVLEVDEAFGGALARELQPHSVLLLNIQVDQLNRFHEPARVATMLEAFAKTATRALVVNGDDRNLRALAGRLASGPAVQSFFAVAPEVLEAGSAWLASGDNPLLAQAGEPVDARVVVESASGRSAVLSVDGERVDVRLPARGLHYAVDAAGATALTAALLGERLDLDAVASGLADMAAVFGRGEILRVGDEDVEIIMMKNPPSLQVNLDSLDDAPAQVFVSVDEGTPDPSWIYDSDLSKVRHVDVLSGTKCWQLATRFAYDEIPVHAIEPDLGRALRRFLALPKPEHGVKTMIVNYEQMMLIRKQLGFRELEGVR